MLVGRNADKLAAAADEINAAAGDGAGSVLLRTRRRHQRGRGRPRWWRPPRPGRGRLHGVVHCAGGSETIGPLTQLDSEAWRRTVDLNVNGTMYVLKHAAREMVRGGGGSFVGISSIAASNTHRWFGAYGVSKAAIDHLMQLAADELGASWVRVNCIRPGLIRTELVAPVLDSPELSGDYAAARRCRGPARSRTSPTRRCSCSATRELHHRPGDQRRRRAAGAPRPRLTRRCSSRSSARTACAASSRASTIRSAQSDLSPTFCPSRGYPQGPPQRPTR